MKNHKKCVIIFISLLIACYLAIDITKALKGEKLIFFERWRLSNKGYAKNIEVKSYLLTDEQLINLLSQPKQDVKQPSQNELYNKNINLVLRIKNHGQGVVWGTLAWKIGEGGWGNVEVDDMPPIRVSYAKTFNDFIIPVGNIIFFDKDIPSPKIQVKWKRLYRYK